MLDEACDAYSSAGHYAVNRDYTANGLNQYTAAGGVTPTYDSRGNLTSAGSITYGYDSANMLVSATGSVQLGYDPLRRLAWTTGNPNFTHFAYDNEALIAEYDYSGNLVRRYVHGPGVDEPLVWYEGTGTSDRRWLHADERGSIVAASNASGAPIGYNSYDEYGIPASGNGWRFQYTGQQWIAELGMYHYRARMYSPTLGRFLQTDPIGYAGGMNLYAYVGNDPLNFTDPSGLCRIWGLVKTTAWPNGKVTRDVLSSWMEGCEREEGGSGGGEGPGGDGRGQPAILVVAAPLPRWGECVGQPFASFFADNYGYAAAIGFVYDVDSSLLLGLAASESGYGQSSMARTQNNPFGATPGGFNTLGITYDSYLSAWLNWADQWGARIAGVGSNAQLFVSNLAQDNQGAVGARDSRGPYNTQNRSTGGDPNWSRKVLGTIAGVRSRLTDWLVSWC